MLNIFVLSIFGATTAILLTPRLRASPGWRATVTPLASIIGSGFLISLPLLARDLGSYAIVGMTALIATAYLIGGAIRFNIRYGEKLFGKDGAAGIGALDRVSHLALALAYFISVTYYLSLLAAFLLKGVAIEDPISSKAVTTAILVAIGSYGFWRGLHGLENIEEYAVGAKLGIIAALLAGLLFVNLHLLWNGQFRIEAPPSQISWHAIQIVFGLLITVQGFETSRFLRGAYPAQLRIRTMRNAQLISGAIYFVFFALATILIGSRPARPDVAAIVDMVSVVGTAMPILLTAGAVFAQLSAAVADAIGAAGLIFESDRHHVSRRYAYPLIAAVGIGMTWFVNVFEIIALASKAFALFYAMQCLVAAGVAIRNPAVNHRALRAVGFAGLSIFAMLLMSFGIPGNE